MHFMQYMYLRNALTAILHRHEIIVVNRHEHYCLNGTKTADNTAHNQKLFLLNVLNRRKI
jgi:hypothetical protein